MLLLIIHSITHRLLLIQGLDDRLPIRQLTDLHRPISTAREQVSIAIHLQLNDPLSNVLEEAAACVLSRKRVQGRVYGQTPHLDISVR